MTFENFETKGNASLIEALNFAKALAEGNEGLRWLTLIGKVDRGKTHLAFIFRLNQVVFRCCL
ncbi:hypothetical protein ES703_110572 [subsurface metagenome]